MAPNSLDKDHKGIFGTLTFFFLSIMIDIYVEVSNLHNTFTHSPFSKQKHVFIWIETEGMEGLKQQIWR